jgi:hypothetical protein
MKRLVMALAIVAAGCSSVPAFPAQTPFVPATQAPLPTDDRIAGAGVITFGTAYDKDTLLITNPKSSFKKNVRKIAWSAELSEPAGATSMTFILASRSRSGAEKIIIRQEVDVSSPDFDLFANALDLGLLLDRKAGTYVMRYIREGDVLAEGEFTLTN